MLFECWSRHAHLDLVEVDGLNVGHAVLGKLQAVLDVVNDGHPLCAAHKGAVRRQLADYTGSPMSDQHAHCMQWRGYVSLEPM